MLGDEPQLRLGAIEQARPGKPAGADRGLRLRQLKGRIAAPHRLGVGVEKDAQSIALVVGHPARLKDPYGQQNGCHGERQQQSRLDAGDNDHTQCDGDQDQGRTQIGLQEDEPDRKSGHQQATEHVLGGQGALRRPEPSGKPQQHRHLGQLGRLKLHRPEDQPRLRPVHRRSQGRQDHEHGNQHPQVDQGNVIPIGPVVHQQGRGHDARPQDDIDELALGVEVRVATVDLQAVAGGAVDHHDADQADQHRYQEEEGVDLLPRVGRVTPDTPRCPHELLAPRHGLHRGAVLEARQEPEDPPGDRRRGNRAEPALLDHHAHHVAG